MHFGPVTLFAELYGRHKSHYQAHPIGIQLLHLSLTMPTYGIYPKAIGLNERLKAEQFNGVLDTAFTSNSVYWTELFFK